MSYGSILDRIASVYEVLFDIGTYFSFHFAFSLLIFAAESVLTLFFKRVIRFFSHMEK